MSDQPQFEDSNQRQNPTNGQIITGEPARIPEQPVRVEMPQNKPLVVNTILGITIFVFVLQLSGEYLLNAGLWLGCPYFATNDLPACYGLKVNEFITVYGEWWRLFTPMLLHASLLHIGFNMYALSILGTSLERFYGHWQFLALYIVSGFAGIVASFALTDAPSLGASTAVFGLIGAQGVFAYRNQAVFGALAKRALRDIFMMALLNLMIGFSVPGIDNWGHLGGLLGGVAVAWFGGPIFKIEGLRPNLYMENLRTEGDLAWAGLSVFTLFVAISMAVSLM